MTIRPATAADIPALHRLIEGAYRGEGPRAGWTHESDLLGGQRTDPQALGESIADPDQLLLVRAALDGCVNLARRAGGIAYLGLLTVRPTAQGSGLGRQLLAAAETAAATRFDANTVEMTVIRQRRELIAWYERRGYALTGEERPFPLDDARFGLPIVRDLSFVVLAKRLV